ncbi:UDP-N-acetylmuramoyl-tripeptide--D-alanyl-D-alanine ligase [Candidatus Uhrbacteria bacterium]|nr:UDP-N-acetylmuramoyl-tripeptide--D-alanyl-D-alanine ligase [Candidatus Uhrbacteria bacterium]
MGRKILQNILAFFSRKILVKYHPDIVGITGSIGKTSTKEAIALVLASHFRIRASEKNYNTEVGVPLTIIGAHHPGHSIIGWIAVFTKAARLVWFVEPAYPQLLVLEMGADRPGDIAYLTKLAPCNVGVLTAISEAHLENFISPEQLLAEKQIIYGHLSPDAIAILNADDPYVYPPIGNLRARMVTFGLSSDADVRADRITRPLRFVEGSEEYGGIQCAIHANGESIQASFPHIFRQEHLSCVLAALAVGGRYHIPLSVMIECLREYEAPPGRSRLLPGIKHTLIIDDTYNASPRASRAALDALREFDISESANRIAVLGDMKELGAHSHDEHRKIGEYCASGGIDLLITVGPLAKTIAQAAVEYGMDAQTIESFDAAASAGRYLQNKMKRGDVVLIKGSQDVRLERVVEEVMAEPERAVELLVRQEPYWK